MTKTFAVILSGCGVYDGTEIHEAVLTMLAIKKHQHNYQILAPNINQNTVVNHLNKEVTNETRNVLVESARIARGNIMPLSDFNINNYDAIIFPGGFGAAKNLTNFASGNNNIVVQADVRNAIEATHKAGKPIGAVCIAPTIIASTLKNISITIGNDSNIAQRINNLGNTHINTSKCEAYVDKHNKIVTSPCYMLESDIYEISIGAENVVKEMLNLM